LPNLSKPLSDYLKHSDIIDVHHADILAQATQLRADNTLQTIKHCFEFVRDQIPHCWDIRDLPQANIVTLKASEVLNHKTGLCYAKSHLLAALLRANNIPTALCYQRLILDPDNPAKGYCLHGLNAVWLESTNDYAQGWFRIDPRGNKKGVDAQFNPPIEQLAFTTEDKLECTFPDFYDQPLECVVEKLTKHGDIFELYGDLPDIKPVSE
jgi:transglutaminase-like putative cysteine protease